jgi:hypothetical protein
LTFTVSDTSGTCNVSRTERRTNFARRIRLCVLISTVLASHALIIHKTEANVAYALGNTCRCIGYRRLTLRAVDARSGIDVLVSGLSLSKRKGLALFTTFFTAPMGRGKIQWHLFKSRYTRRTGSVGASSTAAPLARAGSWPCGAKRLSHRTVAGAGGACGRSATIVGNADEQRSARRLSLCAASASMAS